jgi:hypothetical protein
LYATSGWLPVSNLMKLVVLAAGAACVWWMMDRTPRGAALALLVGLTGVVGEVSIIAGGGFSYTKPDLWGVPLWLPALYAAGATAIGHAAASAAGKLG